MIRLSRLADYAVLLMSRMANTPDRVHNALDIAEATGLPCPTVSKLLATLAREGLLNSVRGAKGGYGLAHPAREITVAHIIAAIDGPIAITACIEHPGSCDVESSARRASAGRRSIAPFSRRSKMSRSSRSAPARHLPTSPSPNSRAGLARASKAMPLAKPARALRKEALI